MVGLVDVLEMFWLLCGGWIVGGRSEVGKLVLGDR